MQRFETLQIWQESIKFGVLIDGLTKKFPKDELYSLTNQLRRAAVSISSNIAEGSGANSVLDFSRFIDIAIKSNMEVISQVLFAEKLGYLTPEESKSSVELGTDLIKRIRAFKKYLLTKT